MHKPVDLKLPSAICVISSTAGFLTYIFQSSRPLTPRCWSHFSFFCYSFFIALSLICVHCSDVKPVTHRHGNRVTFKGGQRGFTRLNAPRSPIWSHSHLISLSGEIATPLKDWEKVPSKIRLPCSLTNKTTLGSILLRRNILNKLGVLSQLKETCSTSFKRER